MKKCTKSMAIAKALVLCAIFILFLSLYSCSDVSGKCEHSYSDNFRSSVEFHTPICDKCGKEGEPLDHRFGELVITTPATKKNDGEGYYPCLDCGYQKRETLIGCEHPSYVFVEESESTCYSLGMLPHYKCEDCGRVFDESHNELERNDVFKILSSHNYNLSEPKIQSPGLNDAGYVEYCCHNYENCHSFVRVSLPSFSEGQNYTEITTDKGTTSCTIKESYLRKNFTSDIGDYTRGQIIESVLGISFEYSLCDTEGHVFVKDGFVNENGKLFYVCQSNSLHRYEVSLPTLDFEEYIVTEAKAYCVRGAGDEYQFNTTSWRSVLEPHIDILCNGDSRVMTQFAEELSGGFVIFVGDGSEVDPDVHKDESIVIKNFTPPTFDVYTYEKTVGTVIAYCKDCEIEVERSVDYSEGNWEVSGGFLSRKYTRTYSIFGQHVSDNPIERFKYIIDLNGGTPVTAELETQGYSSEGYITVSTESFIKEGMEIYGVAIAVDGIGLNESQKALKVEECEGWSLKHGSFTYWKIYMGGEEFPGHVSIKLLWKYV